MPLPCLVFHGINIQLWIERMKYEGDVKDDVTVFSSERNPHMRMPVGNSSKPKLMLSSLSDLALSILGMPVSNGGVPYKNTAGFYFSIEFKNLFLTHFDLMMIP